MGERLEKRQKWARWMNYGLRAGYTVEAAGVMAVVFFTIMVLIGQAFRIHGETTGVFLLHESVERTRHAIESIDEREITMDAQGGGWSRTIIAPVFRPENTLRAWCLTEGKQ